MPSYHAFEGDHSRAVVTYDHYQHKHLDKGNDILYDGVHYNEYQGVYGPFFEGEYKAYDFNINTPYMIMNILAVMIVIMFCGFVYCVGFIILAFIGWLYAKDSERNLRVKQTTVDDEDVV